MAGLLTGTGDVTHANSGAGTGPGGSVAYPANSAVGDILIAQMRTGRNASGMTVNVPSGWTKLCDTHFDARLGAYIDGAWYIKNQPLVQADIGGSASFTLSASVRRALSIWRTTGIDLTATLAAVPLATVESFSSSAGVSSYAAPATTPTSAPTLVIHTLALNVAAPTSSPGSNATVTGDTGGPILNDGYTASVASCTNVLTSWKDATDTSQQPAATYTFNNGNNTGGNRLLSLSMAVPAVAPTGTPTRTGAITGASTLTGSSTTTRMVARTQTLAAALSGTKISTRIKTATIAMVGSLSGISQHVSNLMRSIVGVFSLSGTYTSVRAKLAQLTGVATYNGTNLHSSTKVGVAPLQAQYSGTKSSIRIKSANAAAAIAFTGSVITTRTNTGNVTGVITVTGIHQGVHPSGPAVDYNFTAVLNQREWTSSLNAREFESSLSPRRMKVSLP